MQRFGIAGSGRCSNLDLECCRFRWKRNGHHGDKLFAAVCDLGLEGIVSKKLNAPYRSGPSKTWIKVKNPKSPAATRAVDGTF